MTVVASDGFKNLENAADKSSNPNHGNSSNKNLTDSNHAVPHHGENGRTSNGLRTGKDPNLDRNGNSLSDSPHHGKHGRASNGLRTGKDPNLDRIGNSLSNSPAGSAAQTGAKNLASPLTNQDGAGTGSGNPAVSDVSGDGMKSGLPDPAKNKNGQSGLNSRDSNNHDGASGIISGLKSLGSNAPKAAKSAGGKLKSGYENFSNKATTAIIKLGKKSNITLKKKTARWILHVALTSTLGAGLLGAYYVYNSNKPLESGSVCTTRNNGSQAYSGTTSGDGASWTQSGSTEYNNAKAVVEKLKSMGFSGTAIAGIMGNMAQESGFKTSVLNGSGDGGKGLMQWTGGRRAELESFAKSKNMDSGSLDLQLLMMAKELSDSSMWASAYKKISPQILSGSSSPADAALRFYLSAFEAGQGNTSDPDGSGSKREAYAQQAYATFNLSGVHANDSALSALLGGGSESTATANSSLAEGINAALCNGSSNNGDTSSVVSTAESLLGYFTYSQGNRTDVAKSGSYSNISSLSQVKRDGQTDCSGYVWLVLKLAGYSVPDQMWFTGSMNDFMNQGKYLKEVDQSQAKAGTVIFTNGSGNDHAAILLENYHGTDTKMINEGGSSDGGVNESTIGNAFGPYWNHYHFANPIKK